MDSNQPENFKIPTGDQGRTKRVFFLVLAVVFVILILVSAGLGIFRKSSSGNAEFIDYKNFVKSTHNVNYGTPRPVECYEMPDTFKAECMIKGGKLTYEVTNTGLSNEYHFGCFPTDKAKDVNKKCKADSECEGWCIWMNGDIMGPGDSHTCSSFKKPFFVFGDRNQQNTSEYICGYSLR